jgi:hypothetical protein
MTYLDDDPPARQMSLSYSYFRLLLLILIQSGLISDQKVFASTSSIKHPSRTYKPT